MHYLRVDDAGTKETIRGLKVLYIEVDNEGAVNREIALGYANELVHLYPSKKFKYGAYGIFDLALFDTANLKDDLSKDDFEKIWKEVHLK